MSNFRMKQINEMIHREISNSISKNIIFPEGIIFTITKVITTKDLEEAKIFYIVSPLDKSNTSINILKKNIKVLKDDFASSIILRKTPKLKFVLDKTEIRAKKIENILDKIKDE
ncbi:30S ribosome-binding factor RbfA [Patescibacteria group bacterium]|nr:30S ribosome-binding factor RbfA [Patescibacteria group bacterium]